MSTKIQGSGYASARLSKQMSMGGNLPGSNLGDVVMANTPVNIALDNVTIDAATITDTNVTSTISSNTIAPQGPAGPPGPPGPAGEVKLKQIGAEHLTPELREYLGLPDDLTKKVCGKCKVEKIMTEGDYLCRTCRYG